MVEKLPYIVNKITYDSYIKSPLVFLGGSLLMLGINGISWEGVGYGVLGTVSSLVAGNILMGEYIADQAMLKGFPVDRLSFRDVLRKPIADIILAQLYREP
ncbi:MAG: hypothetical protein Q7S88_00900 [Candidatus Daviesbacteria bacterium]|nr:hypothetical protein [Candidatus Daviesbacteria bacterium]